MDSAWLPQCAALGLWLGGCAAPQPAVTTAQVDVPVGSATASKRTSPPNAPACPKPKHDEYDPPWHRGFVKEPCVRDARGRWASRGDPTDVDGWRHFLDFTPATGAEAEPFSIEVISPMDIALRTDGACVVIDLKDHISLVSPRGELLWRKPFPRCGYVHATAISYDHHISLGCGYSLLHFQPNGDLSYQKWPFGDHSLGGPWVDRDGTLYVTGEGSVAALDPHGDVRWKVSTGFNRATSQLGWSAAGDLVFDTSMAEIHSDPAKTNGMRIYWETEPGELFVLSRSGKIISREKHDNVPAKGWPETLPYPQDGAHRVDGP
ncbi:MAG: PQQ-like beta-propeller repeat protein [Polyangiaceae bacterium]|nr:PQQ-like beta-propeller repeat protein [Myxococcales bacterium]MCB9587569.1 PQQ-like beta-propeller repeat protein [Polyangiaceae bacterium]MCB9605634.1 PQQ-like beta-propeller repeat protein [Polyangiaceae bacterium]